MDTSLLSVLGPLAGTVFGFLIAILSEPIRQRWNRTRVSLSFTTPEHNHGPYRGCVYWPGEPSNPQSAIWVRMYVRNEKKRLARSCQQFLATVEKKTENGQYKLLHRDMLRLKWSFRDFDKEPAIDIPGELGAYCDVFKTGEESRHLMPLTTPECPWEQLLSEPGEYRLEVVVGGDNLDPQREYVRVKWTGKWDELQVGGGKEGPMAQIAWDGSSNQGKDANV